MIDNSSTTSVKILDKEYRISCPREEEASLQRAAHQLHDKMKEIKSGGKVIGLERIAVMAALNMSYELLQLKESQFENNTDAQQQIQDMMGKLDQALTNLDS
ncbi:cell division protein ZapA [Endozoicomonas gorgoniicola]|uniref:Cell division protein ZapA n=1 Tax=Endozoicomonas gorgoniicola TaxID=1234144 RepID=A0ABT3N2K8_9GAMM|nr:cell division protein ZapA [Endozoicomonas gorgoniicola]MCW7555846.1 cell division protein ZapA [Endozoicomonas gorgoniicola]